MSEETITTELTLHAPVSIEDPTTVVGCLGPILTALILNINHIDSMCPIMEIPMQRWLALRALAKTESSRRAKWPLQEAWLHEPGTWGANREEAILVYNGIYYIGLVGA